MFSHPPADSFGPLLAQLRTERGLSQLRLAERLCAASGVSTVSRHEVSRWEREVRLPGPFWLGWLAAVLEVPPQRLTSVLSAGRAGSRAGGAAGLAAPARGGAASVGA